MWPVALREPGLQNSPRLPETPPGPDFSTLVDVLIDLRQIPDAAGETVLDSREAARIRSCGFVARKGLWRCPLIPPEFLLPGLWHLAPISTRQPGPSSGIRSALRAARFRASTHYRSGKIN